MQIAGVNDNAVALVQFPGKLIWAIVYRKLYDTPFNYSKFNFIMPMKSPFSMEVVIETVNAGGKRDCVNAIGNAFP